MLLPLRKIWILTYLPINIKLAEVTNTVICVFITHISFIGNEKQHILFIIVFIKIWRFLEGLTFMFKRNLRNMRVT